MTRPVVALVDGEVRDCRCLTVRHEHGTYGAYSTDRCRCRRCRDANNVVKAVQRMRHAQAFWAGHSLSMVDAAGTRRRLQALAVVGWSTVAIGQRLDRTQQAVCLMRVWPGRLQMVNARRVADVYDELWDATPTGLVNYVKRHAARQGWLPPLAWDDDTIDDPAAMPYIPLGDPALLDEVAIEEALRGRPVTLTKAEREQAVRRGRARGMSVSQTALMLRMPGRSVVRDRKAVAA